MALSHADLDALDAAIASSELEVEVDGRRHRYRSIAELRAARAHVQTVIQEQASAAGGRRPTVFRFRPTTARGF